MIRVRVSVAADDRRMATTIDLAERGLRDVVLDELVERVLVRRSALMILNRNLMTR
jgi:hypothetical protein